jgi:hypothetical protein
MERTVRSLKKDDEKKVEKAIFLIKELMQLNSKIENNLWASSLFYTLIECYIISGFTFEQFQKEMQVIIQHYKSWWPK